MAIIQGDNWLDENFSRWESVRELSVREFSWVGVFRLRVFLGGSCPGGNFPGGSFPGWELSRWEFSWVGVVQVGIFWEFSWVGIVQVRLILGGNFLWWKFFGWELSGGKHSGGNFLGGSFHATPAITWEIVCVLLTTLTQEDATYVYMKNWKWNTVKNRSIFEVFFFCSRHFV